MSEFPEFVQLRAIAGTNKLLRETACREGKKLSEIMREALEARLGQRREDDETRAA